MPGLGKLVGRRAGAVGVALTAVDLWRRLTPKQREWVAAQAKEHGPRVAREVWAAQKKRRPGAR